ncbi:barstar family protein [Brevundimonas sp.]|uniref:barstar family protein n=1 Tax=Brevundimonas sp. TaxID=1871086 RepID=UPI00356A40CF
MSALQIHKVEIDCRELTDWQAFHSAFAEKLGFPSYYGRNMDAWYDCFYSLADESTVLKLAEGDVVWLELKHYKDLQARQPELAEAILEGAAFVNFTLDDERGRAGTQPWTLIGAVAVSAFE